MQQEPAARRRGRPPLEGRRTEILDAAVRVLAERGIEGLSLAQLADALGFSTYALTYHFGAREELLAAVVEHLETRAQTEFAAFLAQPGLSISELARRYWCTTQAPGADRSLRLWLELIVLATRDPSRFPGFLDRAALGWRTVIASAIGDRPDAEELATLAFATLTGLELVQLLEPGSARPGAALDLMIEMFEAALAQP